MLPDVSRVCGGSIDEFNGVLWPEEEAYIAGAVSSRQHSFAAGRGAARAALSELGVVATGIPVGEGRAPTWPDQVVGSISHTGEVCAAAVALASTVQAIGIDIERVAAFPSSIRQQIGTEAELVELRSVIPDQCTRMAVVFSVKESIFKAVYPHTRHVFEFLDVHLEPVEHSDALQSAATDTGLPGAALIGSLVNRWRLVDDFVVSVAYSLPTSEYSQHD